MTGVVVTRKKLLGCAASALLLGVGTLWFNQPDRQLRRAWDELLDAVEARNATRLGRILDPDYADRWDYTRQTLLDDARLAFLQFQKLAVEGEQVRIARRGRVATITARLRVKAEGGGHVNEARAAINALFTPCTFEWQREDGLFGAWHLIGFYHPELDLRRFRTRW